MTSTHRFSRPVHGQAFTFPEVVDLPNTKVLIEGGEVI